MYTKSYAVCMYIVDDIRRDVNCVILLFVFMSCIYLIISVSIMIEDLIRPVGTS